MDESRIAPLWVILFAHNEPKGVATWKLDYTDPPLSFSPKLATPLNLITEERARASILCPVGIIIFRHNKYYKHENGATGFPSCVKMRPFFKQRRKGSADE
jgi:hypothetical protein